MQRMTIWSRKLGLFTLAGVALSLSCGGRGADDADEAQAEPEMPVRDSTTDEPMDDVPSNVPVDPGQAPPPAANGSPRIVEIPFLMTTSPPPECTANLPRWLPNCTPGTTTPHGIDCDGDGVWDYQVYNCDLSTAQTPPYFAGSFDCEPTDPTLKYGAAPDADGDGTGTGARLGAGPTMPAGYVAVALDSEPDCNDDDASIHTGAPDTWGDGIDSDCYNGDLPACET